MTIIEKIALGNLTAKKHCRTLWSHKIANLGTGPCDWRRSYIPPEQPQMWQWDKRRIDFLAQ
jgi:hypothetical protein